MKGIATTSVHQSQMQSIQQHVYFNLKYKNIKRNLLMQTYTGSQNLNV